MACAASSVCATGFSTRTGLPAASAASAGSRCRSSGVQTITPGDVRRRDEGVEIGIDRAPALGGDLAREVTIEVVDARQANALDAAQEAGVATPHEAQPHNPQPDGVRHATPFPLVDSSGCGQPLEREVAGGEPPRQPLLERRRLLGADRSGHRAAGMKGASGRRIGRLRRLPGEANPLPAPAQRRHGRDERAGVGMERPLVELGRRSLLDDLAEVHDGDAVAHVADDAEIVRDEDVGQPAPLLQIPQEVEHLGLHRDVERRDGLVEQQQRGLDRQRPGDADPLPLPAAELEWVVAATLRVQSHLLHQRADPALDAGAIADAMDAQRVGDDLRDPHPRRQRGVGVLEDDLDMPAQASGVGRGHRLPGEANLAARRRLQEEQGLHQRRLAAAAFADETERFSGRQRQGHAVDGAHRPALAPKQPLSHGDSAC